MQCPTTSKNSSLKINSQLHVCFKALELFFHLLFCGPSTNDMDHSSVFNGLSPSPHPQEETRSYSISVRLCCTMRSFLKERGPTETLPGRKAETDRVCEGISEGFRLAESGRVAPRGPEANGSMALPLTPPPFSIAFYSPSTPPASTGKSISRCHSPILPPRSAPDAASCPAHCPRH
jgi:hypothetical protein